MIDETILRDALHRAGERIEPPASGPESIMIAAAPLRHPLPWKGTAGTALLRRVRVRALAAVAAALALAVVSLFTYGALQSHPQTAGQVQKQALGGAPSPNNEKRAFAPAAPGEAAMAPSHGAPRSAATGTPSITPGTGQPAEVQKTGNVSLVVPEGKVGTTLTSLTSLASGNGGWVDSSSSSAGSSPATQSGTITLRVPVGAFENVLNQVRGLGTVTSASTQSQDVTAEDANDTARITALEAGVNQLEALMPRAQDISDVLTIQQQIGDLQSQIDQLQAQQQVLQNEAAYSTLTVDVSAAGAPPPKPPVNPSGMQRAWDGAVGHFVGGVEAVVRTLGTIAFLVVLAGALALIANLVWRYGRRRLV